MSQRTRFAVGCIVASALALLVASGAAQEPLIDDGATFKGKIVYIVTKPKDAKSDTGYALFEKAEVKRLGDRYFLAGLIPAQGDGPIEKAQQGKKVWMPISDIVQISEFNSVEEALTFFAETAKAAPQLDR